MALMSASVHASQSRDGVGANLSGNGRDRLGRWLRCSRIGAPWLVAASTPAGRCGSAPRGGAACPGWDADRQVKLVRCIGEVKGATDARACAGAAVLGTIATRFAWAHAPLGRALAVPR